MASDISNINEQLISRKAAVKTFTELVDRRTRGATLKVGGGV